MCVVTGPLQYSADLLHEDLEIPCCYIFKAIGVFERRKMIGVILSEAIVPIDESDSKTNQIEETPPDDNEAASEADWEILESNELLHKRRKLSDTKIRVYKILQTSKITKI